MEINLSQFIKKQLTNNCFFDIIILENRGGLNMKKIFKRKKLNNKGFTLIELLAVIVILAIVMGVAANAILNVMNDSRKNTFIAAVRYTSPSTKMMLHKM